MKDNKREQAESSAMIIRNHPYMIFTRVISVLSFIAFLILRFGTEDMDIWELLGELFQKSPYIVIGVPGGVILIVTIFFYFDWRMKAVYQYEDKLVYQKGVFILQKITLRYEKISGVDINRPLFYRFFRLSKLKIDSNTVVDAKNAINLVVGANMAELIKKDVLNRIETINMPRNGESIKNVSGNSPVKTKAFSKSEPPIFVLSKGKIVVMFFLSILMVFALVVPYGLVAALLGVQIFPDAPSEIGVYLGLGMLGLFVFITIISIISTFFLYHNFMLYKTTERLHVSYGLIELKNISVPFKKINGIKIKQNLLQRMVRIYSVEVLCSSYGDENNELNATIAPCATKAQVELIVNEIYQNIPEFDTVIKPKSSAKLLYFFPAVIVLVIINALNLVGVPENALYAFGGVTLMYCVIAGILQYLNTALRISNGFCKVDKGGIFHETLICPVSRCQSVVMTSGPLQRVLKKGTLKVKLFCAQKNIAGNIVLRHMERELGEAFFKK